MKLSVFLSGFLLFLVPDWTESVEDDTVDINTLARGRIINFFEKNDAEKEGRCSSGAINVLCIIGILTLAPEDPHIVTEPSASMKFIVISIGFLLLSLLHQWTKKEEQKVNLATLGRIIQFLKQKYNDNKAYAVIIKIPKNQCEKEFDPFKGHFLSNVNAEHVQKGIYKTKSEFYEGVELMAAGPHRRNIKTSENCSSKSVSKLLKNAFSYNFLQRNVSDSCIIVYSVYYPCLNDFKSDIIPALDSHYSRIKAFVFEKVYMGNNKSLSCSDATQNFTEFQKYVDLYCFANGSVKLLHAKSENETSP